MGDGPELYKKLFDDNLFAIYDIQAAGGSANDAPSIHHENAVADSIGSIWYL